MLYCLSKLNRSYNKQGRIYITWGPWHFYFGNKTCKAKSYSPDFHCIILPNKGEVNKKRSSLDPVAITIQERGPLARALQLPRPLPITFYLLQNRRLSKKIKNAKLEKKKLRFRGRTETFFTQDLVYILFCAARWCYVKPLLLMGHCKIEHSLLVLYIQKNFTITSKTIYIYVFCFFLRINSGQN